MRRETERRARSCRHGGAPFLLAYFLLGADVLAVNDPLLTKAAQSKLQFRSVVASVKDYAIFTLTPSGHVASWNAGAESIKGWTESEIVGQHFSIFYTPEDVALGKPARLLDLAQVDGRIEDEGWRVRKDGSRFWSDVVITRMLDDKGDLLGFVKVTRDLTQRRAAAEALRHSEERLRLMIESVEDYAILMLDRGGIISSWNAGAQRMKGYRAAEIVGQHFSKLYPPEDVAAGKPARELEEAAAHGRFEDEGWRIRKDGSRFWANVVVTPMRAPDGELVGFTKVTRDMTERRRAEQETAARARRQTALAELGRGALETRDLSNVLAYATAAVADTLECTGAAFFEELEGQLLLRAAHGCPDEIAAALAESGLPATALRERRPARFDAVAEPLGAVLRERGVFHWVAVPVPAGPEAGPSGVLTAFCTERREITPDEVHFLEAVVNIIATAAARREVEESLRRAERRAEEERQRLLQAEEAVHEREAFISIAAHELRTPLTTLKLKLSSALMILRRELGPVAAGEKLRTRVTDAAAQADRLNQLVTRLMDVSRIVTGRLDLTRDRVDLAALVHGMASSLQEQAAAAGSDIRVETSGDAIGYWDPLRLEQVVVNLLSNALKFGTGAPVEVHVEDQGDSVELRVVDHGIGISSEDAARIFERFERAVPLRHYGGLGLGLYIAKSIVEAHRGTIDVESEPGNGATFRVRLPKQADLGYEPTIPNDDAFRDPVAGEETV